MEPVKVIKENNESHNSERDTDQSQSSMDINRVDDSLLLGSLQIWRRHFLLPRCFGFKLRMQDYFYLFNYFFVLYVL